MIIEEKGLSEADLTEKSFLGPKGAIFSNEFSNLMGHDAMP